MSAGATFSLFDGSDKETLDLMRISEAIGWGKYGKPEELRRDLDARKAAEGLQVHVAKVAGKLVAFIEIHTKPHAGWKVERDGVYIHAIGVDPAWQRRELAKPFGAHVLKLLKQGGAKTAVTDIQWDNTKSIRLAQGLGAEMLGPAPDALAKHRGAPQIRLRFTL